MLEKRCVAKQRGAIKMRTIEVATNAELLVLA